MIKTTNSIVNIKSLCKSYGDQRVVDNIDLQVQRGECFGLLGPNGAGKTTTLRMMLGMTPPDSGELKILDYLISQKSQQVRQRIGVVPQMDNLDPDFSVIENLRTYASYFKLAGKELNERITELLEFARLTQKADEPIESLSGGMKRRLTLARALVNNPELLILDEPTTGLDPQARQLIWQRLRELKHAGRTLILTTHYMEEAQRLCDRLAIMDHGKIIVQGSPQELIDAHIEPHVIEVQGNDVDHWMEQFLKHDTVRFESLGESLFLYTHDEKPIIDDLCKFNHLDFIHRRANLEDVFLKLTGRDLREE
jgi:lipooligosaccharide transport system ATP-binding protein